MDNNGGNILFSNDSSTFRSRCQNGGNLLNNNLHRHFWELNNTSSRYDWCDSSNAAATSLYTTTNSASCTAATTSTHPEGGSPHALFSPGNYDLYHNYHHHHHLSLYGGDGSHLHPDPHLTCLKLGKRHYFEDANHQAGERQLQGLSVEKRGKPYYSLGGGGHVRPSSTAAVVPRCQVEGCHVALVNAKDYHKRHKVCEMHSKAPKVVVLGLEQRFCQQCSRFHVVSEFDEAKRSCRRRLAGHNERRRKNSSHESSHAPKNSASQDQLIMGRFQYLTSRTGCALSLLSSKADYWVSPPDISSRSSAALRELIAEHRATILARQLILDRHLHPHHAMPMQELCDSYPSSNFIAPNHHQILAEPHGWDDRFHDNATHLTLDLMQAPTSAMGFMSTRGKNKEEEAASSEIWNSLEGAPAV